ncbi:beta-galactosidase [Nitriliruptor alkaliphilus]|uniref:beta-galactosidase n=1 Tax=Nitriliruptor alkaliphilus TaxID=427918 RepID=UPI000695FA0F|nr:beta-galactosidase [Nitriliruptor alkaliphilus]
MKLGVCWEPEQHPRATWAGDVDHMVDLGFSVVRIGEFAWSTYEPARDRFAWGWLDDVLDLLHTAGLEVVLGTPTATPPAWLLAERPDIAWVGADGRAAVHGSRRHTCPTSPAYREEAARIVGHLLARYADHPAIVAWQVDNEPGNHATGRCWCDACGAAFPAWLRERFPDAAALNAAWAGPFWSTDYGSLDDVALPVPTVTAHDPALELAHRRFGSHQHAQAVAAQRELIRVAAPGRDVFTNVYAGDLDLDPRELARPSGLGAIDSYPHGLDGPAEVAFHLDLARGLALPTDAGPEARGGRAWIAEQQPGPVNWTPDNPAVPPGQVRLWCWQAALHGIETTLLFRWRAARRGQEQHHAAVLRHDGTEAPAADEVRRLVAELPAAPVRPAATVALPFAHLDGWQLEVQPHLPGATHRELTVTAHAAAARLGLDVDVVPDDSRLAAYPVVLAPALHTVTTDRIRRLEAALDAGSTVVLGPRSLVRDLDAAWVDRPLPADLAGRLGARVDHHGSPAGWPRDPQDVSAVRIGDQVLPAGGWIETFTLEAPDTEVLATAEGGPLHGAPVVVRRGALVLVGAASREVWVTVLATLLDRTPHPEHLEVVTRDGREVVLDHRTRTITGLAGVPPA